MISIISLSVSIIALIISGFTAWLTLLRKGTVLMTRPAVIFLGPDGGPKTTDLPPKIYLCSLLYATSKRGRIVESMYVRLKRGETTQNFSIWTYGDKQLSRGSGLYVPESGITANHHFLLPFDGTSFQFLAGAYILEVFASVVGERTPRLLYSVKLEITSEQEYSLKDKGNGLFFDWGPDAGKYSAHIRVLP
jgi:hypothetical protein